MLLDTHLKQLVLRLYVLDARVPNYAGARNA